MRKSLSDFLKCLPTFTAKGPHLGAALLVCLTCLLCACSINSKMLGDYVSPSLILPKDVVRALTVVHATPSGDLVLPEQYSTFTFVFNQPVVNLGTTQVDIEGLSIEPPVKGVWAWRGTACLTFTPKEPLLVSHAYQVTVPAGLKAITGQTLAKPYTMRFVTPRPAIIHSSPAEGNANVSLDKPIFLLFNQPINNQTALESLRLTSSQGVVPCQARTATEAEFKAYIKELRNNEGDRVTMNGLSVDLDKLTAEQLIVLEHKSPFRQGQRYTVTAPANFKADSSAEHGSLTEESFSFKTYDIFSLKSVTSVDGNHPEEDIIFTFTNPVKMNDLSKALSFEPPVDMPKDYWEDSYSSSELRLNLPLKPSTTYKIKISSELKDEFNNKISKSEKINFTTADFKPRLSLSSGQAVVEAKVKDASLPFGSININSIKVEGKAVSIQELVKMAQDDFFFGGIDDYQPQGGFTYVKDIALKNKPNVYADSNIDLKPIFKGNSRGLALVRLTYRNEASKEEYKTVLVQLTDLCLTAKFSAINNLLWVTSLDSGKPAANVKVTLYNEKAERVFTGHTDKKGLVKAPGWSKYTSAQDGLAPKQYMLASYGDDLAFIYSSGANSLDTWKCNIFSYSTPYKDEIRSCVFTDKGVYSPGEELKFKVLLRSNKQARLQLPKFLKTVHYKVKDGEGNTFAKGTCPVSAMGSANGSVKVPLEASPGYAFMELTIPEKEAQKLDISSWLGSVSYRIDDYQPVQTEAKIVSPQKSLLLGEEFKGRIEGRFLFGAPMDNDRFRYSSSIDKAPYFSKKYPDYSFYSKIWGQDDDFDSTTLISGSGRLDNKGQFAFEIPTEGVHYQCPSMLSVEGTVISSSLKEVSSSLQVPVWPASNIVGIKLDSYLAKQDQPLQGQLLAVDKNEEAQKGVPIKIELIRKSWDSVYKAGVGGAYNWVSDSKEEIESTQTIISGTGPVNFSLIPKNAGNYIIRASITDKKGRCNLNETEVWCSGSGYAAWERHDDNELSLKTNAESYLPGQTAAILVQSPFEEAEALVSVETDSVIDSWNVKLQGTAPIVKVPIKSFYAPNVYVSVILVKGREGKTNLSQGGLDLSKPTFRFGYTELKVDNPKSKLKVEVLSDFAQYKPGQTASVTLKLSDSQGKPVSGEVCLWAVDEGVLNLVGYKLPNYYDIFYAKRDLNVVTSENCADVIGLRSYGSKGANQGGGGGNDDKVRDDFTPTVVWKPSIAIDDTGHTVVRFKAPDSLTRYRIIAVACDNGERFGQGQATFEVSKKLVLLPSVIKYARCGDSFQVGVLARNNTDKTSSVTIKAQSQGLNLANDSFRATLKPTEEKVMLFDVSAPNCGHFPIKFKGQMGIETDICQYTIDVIPDERTNVAAVSGEFDTKEAAEYVKVPNGAKVGSAILDISVSNNFSSQLNGAVQKLWDEDIIALDTILARTEIILLSDRLGLKLPQELNSEAKRKAAVKTYCKELEKFRTLDSGFSLWPGTKVGSNVYTAWALDIMTKLKKIGCLDSEREYMYTGTKLYAKDTIYASLLELPKVGDGNGDPGIPMLFASLCKTGEGQNSTLVVLYRARRKFSLSGRAYILKAAAELNNQEIVNALRQELNNTLKIEERQAWFEEDGASELSPNSERAFSNVSALSAMLRSGDFKFAPKVFAWLFSHKVTGTWGSELTDAKVAEALTTYTDKEQVVRNDVEVKVRSGGKQLLKGTLKYPEANCLFASNPIAAIGQEVPIEMSKTGSGKLYYDLLLRYAPIKPMPATDHGFYIFQSCTTLDDLQHPIPFTELKVGQVYKVSVSVISPVNRDQVVVNVPLPAGLEVVNTTFDTESNLYSNLLNKVNPDPDYGTFTDAAYYSDHVKVWAEGLQAGEHTYSFLARAVSCGHYRMPGARIYQKNCPEVFGCTSETRLKIVP